MTEGALRYRLKKLEAGPARDGRSDQPTALDGYVDVVEAIRVTLEDGRLTGESLPAQVRQIYNILVRDHGYGGQPPSGAMGAYWARSGGQTGGRPNPPTERPAVPSARKPACGWCS